MRASGWESFTEHIVRIAEEENISPSDPVRNSISIPPITVATLKEIHAENPKARVLFKVGVEEKGFVEYTSSLT